MAVVVETVVVVTVELMVVVSTGPHVSNASVPLTEQVTKSQLYVSPAGHDVFFALGEPAPHGVL